MADDIRTQPTDDDEGKDVVDSTGETIGVVTAVEGGTLHVESDPGLTESLKATLGWGDTEDTRTIDEQHISEIADDAVHIQADDPEAMDADAGGPGATGTADPDTGPTTEGAETDAETEPTADREASVDDDVSTPRSTDTGGSPEDEMEVSETPMDDTGDVTNERTAGEAGASEMTDEQVSERSEGSATDEMGVPAGEDEATDRPSEGTDDEALSADANERPPGAADTSGQEDVHDAQTDDLRGEEDVQDPMPEEPRDAEDVQETAEEIDPEEEPSTGEAATRGIEEEGTELGREEETDDRSEG